MNEELVAVIDLGSSSTKGGFSAHDIPESVFPSVMSTWHKGMECMESNLDNFVAIEAGSILAQGSIGHHSIHPMQRGIVKDWDQMSSLWQKIIDEIGIPSSDSTSIMFVESTRMKAADRAKWAQILFETYRSPSVCFGNSSSMCVFAAGRTTGLAVDCGAGITSVVPVYEGLALKHAAICMDYGGQDITSSLRKLLGDKHGVQISFNDARSVKESMCFVQYQSTSPGLREEKVTLTLPDGIDVDVDSRVFADCTNQYFFNDKVNPKGLISQTAESIKLCDDSIRRSMLHNIVIAGGTSMMRGLGDRLAWDLNAKLQQELKYYSNNDLKVTPNSYNREAGYTSQRKYAAWIGGSIFSSLETYKELKITRQEWEENADAILQTKCY